MASDRGLTSELELWHCLGFPSAAHRSASTAIGPDGALYLVADRRHICKLLPGSSQSKKWMGRDDGDSLATKSDCAMERVGLLEPHCLSFTKNSDALYYAEAGVIKRVKAGKVKTVASVKTSGKIRFVLDHLNGLIWALPQQDTRLFRASMTSRESVTLKPYAGIQGLASVYQEGPVQLALFAQVQVLTISPHSGAIYFTVSNTASIKRLWRGFVTHITGGHAASVAPPSVHKLDGSRKRPLTPLSPCSTVLDGPLHSATFATIVSMVINSQEDIIIGGNYSLRLARNGLVSTIFSTHHRATPDPVLSFDSYHEIVFSSRRIFFSPDSFQQFSIQRPWNRVPAGVTAGEFTSLIQEKVNIRPPYPMRPRSFRDLITMAPLCSGEVHSKLDPKKFFQLTNATTGRVWQLHRDLLTIRCSSLLRDDVQKAFCLYTEEVQSLLLNFIFADQLPEETTIVADAEVSIAMSKCGLSDVYEFLLLRISKAVREPGAPLYQSLVDCIQRLPEDQADVYIDLIVQQMRQTPSEIHGKIGQLKQITHRAAGIIAKFLDNSKPIPASNPKQAMKNPRGQFTTIFLSILPWIPSNPHFTMPEGFPTSASSERASLHLTSPVQPLATLKPNPIKDLKLIKPSMPPDFTVVCQGVRFPCHKWILLARWPMLRGRLDADLYRSGKLPDSATIDMVPAEFMESLLIWFYCGDNNIFSTVEHCLTFLQHGERLGLILQNYEAKPGMESLAEFCKNGAVSDLHPTTAVRQLRAAQLMGDVQSVSRCIDYIASHIGQILADSAQLETWTSIGAQVLVKCFEQSFKCNSISDLVSGNPSLSVPSFFVETLSGNGCSGLFNGPTHSATFNQPSGIHISPYGDIVVSDTGNHVIRSLRGGGWTHTLAGNGIGGYNFGSFDKAQFSMPLSLGRSQDGDVYVADHMNDRIRVLKPSIREVKTFCGVGRKGENPTVELSSMPKTLKSAQLTLPTGLCIHGSRIFISQSARHCILEASSGFVNVYAGNLTPSSQIRPKKTDKLENGDDMVIDVWKGFEDGSKSNARFDSPHGLCMASDEDLIVADSGNHCVRLVSLSEVKTIAGVGKKAGFFDGASAAALFHYPTDVAAYGDRIYISDCANHRIRMLHLGMVSTVCGSGVGGFLNGFSSESRLYFPSAICVGQEGEILIADTSNHAIRIAREIFPTYDKKAAPTSSGHVPVLLAPETPLHATFPPMGEMMRLKSEADVKWTHRFTGLTIELHSIVVKLRLPHLLEDRSDDLVNLLDNNTVSSSAVQAFIYFIYNDTLPSWLDLKEFSETVCLLSLCGHPAFMEHAQFILDAKLNLLEDPVAILSILSTLLSQNAAPELLDIVVPKLRSNPSMLCEETVNNPSIPATIVDVLSKVVDVTMTLHKAPQTSALSRLTLSALIASIHPEKHHMFPSIQSTNGALPEDTASQTPRIRFDFKLLSTVPGDTLLTFGENSIICHSAVLMARWPVSRHLTRILDLQSLRQEVPPFVTKHLHVPNASPELINALLAHIYTDSGFDSHRYGPELARIEESVGFSTAILTDTSDWTFMGYSDPIRLETCAKNLMSAISSRNIVEEEQLRGFIRQRLGLLLHHPMIGQNFRSLVPIEIIASLIMENYGISWPLEVQQKRPGHS